MSNNNLVDCTKIVVDCVQNDSVDIRCGGPQYLGFDFYVKGEQAEEMKKFIALTLETFEIPIVRMYLGETKKLSESNVWTKERIVAEINKEAAYLKSELRARNFSSSFKK